MNLRAGRLPARKFQQPAQPRSLLATSATRWP
jgi:hypothetical protein